MDNVVKPALATLDMHENEFNNSIDEISDEAFTTNDGFHHHFETLAEWLDTLGEYISERQKCGFLVKLQFQAVSAILRSYLMK